MPKSPKKPCTTAGCKSFAEIGGKCVPCKEKIDREYELSRKPSNKRGYDYYWRKVRDVKLNRNPLCERCLLEGREVPADLVHHKKSVESAPELRLTLGNLESLCTGCHEEEHGSDRWRVR